MTEKNNNFGNNEAHDSDDVAFADSDEEIQQNQQVNLEIEEHQQQPTQKIYKNPQIRKLLYEREQEFYKRQSEANMNNMPTDIGKQFSKFLKLNFLDKKLQIPEMLRTFVMKKKKTLKVKGLEKQNFHYRLEDFNQFMSCDLSREYFQFFLTNFAFSYLQASNRVFDPSLFIQTIEHYLLCAKSSSRIGENRPRNNKQKKKKRQLKLISKLSKVSQNQLNQ